MTPPSRRCYGPCDLHFLLRFEQGALEDLVRVLGRPGRSIREYVNG